MSQSNQESNPLAQEMAAQMQLGVFGTVGKLARQLRAIQRIAPQLHKTVTCPEATGDRSLKRRAVGLAAAHQSIAAFAGTALRGGRSRFP